MPTSVVGALSSMLGPRQSGPRSCVQRGTRRFCSARRKVAMVPSRTVRCIDGRLPGLICAACSAAASDLGFATTHSCNAKFAMVLKGSQRCLQTLLPDQAPRTQALQGGESAEKRA